MADLTVITKDIYIKPKFLIHVKKNLMLFFSILSKEKYWYFRMYSLTLNEHLNYIKFKYFLKFEKHKIFCPLFHDPPKDSIYFISSLNYLASNNASVGNNRGAKVTCSCHHCAQSLVNFISKI